VKCEVGNIYAAKGGRDTKFWLLVSIKPGTTSACVLGLDAEFNIVSAHTYTTYALERRKVVGRVNIEEVRFIDDSRSELEIHIPCVATQEDTGFV